MSSHRIRSETSRSLLSERPLRFRKSKPGQISSHRASYTAILMLLSIVIFAMVLVVLPLNVLFGYSPYEETQNQNGTSDYSKALERELPRVYHTLYTTAVFVLILGIFITFCIFSLINQIFKRAIYPKNIYVSLAFVAVITTFLSSWSIFLANDSIIFPDDYLGMGNSFFNTYLLALDQWEENPSLEHPLNTIAQSQQCCGLYGVDDFWTGRTLNSIGKDRLNRSLGWNQRYLTEDELVEVVPKFCCVNQTDPMCNIVNVTHFKQPEIYTCGCGLVIKRPYFMRLVATAVSSTMVVVLSITTMFVTFYHAKKTPPSR